MKRIAYVDLHNIVMSLARQGSRINWKRFFVYLKEKYKIDDIRIYVGYIPKHKVFYDHLQSLGYTLLFREVYIHPESKSPKANVDTEIVYDALIDRFDSGGGNIYYLVTCDGDYDVLIKDRYEHGCMGKLFVSTRGDASWLLLKYTKQADVISLSEIEKLIMSLESQSPYYYDKKEMTHPIKDMSLPDGLI